MGIDELKKWCETCAFFVEDGPGSECHRYPPKEDKRVADVFPNVCGDSFCGEWQPMSWHDVLQRPIVRC